MVKATKKPAKKLKAKKEEVEVEEETEEEEETENADTPPIGYAGEKQPTWVTEPPEDADGATIESARGFRLHIWPNEGKVGRVMVTGKDWEDGEGLHPGKVIKMNGQDLVDLLNGVLKDIFGHDMKLEWETSDDEEDDD